MRALIALLAAGALLWPAPAAGQASATQLRARLAETRQSHPAGIPDGSLRSIDYTIDVSERIEGRFTEQAASWRRRAASFLDRVQEGHDPFPEQRGRIVNRAYDSELSLDDQGYGIYIPPDYDPSRAWPLIVVLHGGSSNGNLFLGVVLGNNMSWLAYSQYLWNDFEPRWSPNVIVVSPDGFGQVMWRWMGERDVLDVIADVQLHYNVDPDRIILAGLSNGGVGAYAIGTRHAWRFSVVQAIAGAPSWLQYAGGRPLPAERVAMEPFSGLHLAENILDTDFRFYHGRGDTGPMRPQFVTQFEARLADLSIEPNVTWYDAGHDILYRVHRHGRTFDALGEVRRDRRRAEVRLVTGDYRAAQQHWVTVTRMDGYPELAHVRANVEGEAVRVTTDNVLALSLDLRDMPLAEGSQARIAVDGQEVYAGPRAQLGHVIHMTREAETWRLGFPEEPPGTLVKRPGVSGPLTDAYLGRMVHVFGTGNAERRPALEQAAHRGSHGWPLWLWYFRQEVVADTEVTDEMMRDAHLVLYGTAGDNAVLERIRDRLPVRVERDAIVVGTQRYEGPSVGVRFIYPNPLSPDRYVIVQGGVTPEAVAAGYNLPDFLPDYLVYDRGTTRTRQRLFTGRDRALAMGYFDRHWELPTGNPEGGDPAPQEGSTTVNDEAAGGPPVTEEEPLLPIPPAPRRPPRPTVFAAPEDDAAGRVAREIARAATTFPNFRAEIPGATWTVDRRAVWSIQSEAECHRALRAAGVPFRPAPAMPTPVPSPIELTGPVDGVWFRMMHEDRPLEMSCEMALRLPDLVAVLEEHGVTGVDVMSAYRDQPRVSFHTMGLGLDIGRFWTDRGYLSVLTDFVETPASETCRAPRPGARRARILLRIACDLAQTRRLSSVLTPNYNEGHRNHFHIDARPDDPRLFVR